MTEPQITINKTDRANSFEFRYGGAGSGIKIYFEDAADLTKRVLDIAEHFTKIQAGIDTIKSTANSNTKRGENEPEEIY